MLTLTSLNAIKKYALAISLFVLGLVCFYFFLTADRRTSPVSLVEISGKLKDYTFTNNQSGSNVHYLWLREYKALFEFREFTYFGNDVVDVAKQDAPVHAFITEKASKHLQDADASIELHGLAISGTTLIEKGYAEKDSKGVFLLLLAFLLASIGVVIFVAQKFLTSAKLRS